MYEEQTYPTLPYAQGLNAPFIAYGSFKSIEPPVIQLTEPPVRGTINGDLPSGRNQHTVTPSGAQQNRTYLKMIRRMKFFKGCRKMILESLNDSIQILIRHDAKGNQRLHSGRNDGSI